MGKLEIKINQLKELEKEINKTQVVILAGGKAKRMGGIAKPLLKIGGKTLLDYTIEFYKRCGFKDFRFLVGYQHEKIEEYVGDGSEYDIRVKYSLDPDVEHVGKGKALKHALEKGVINKSKRSVISFPDDMFLDDRLPIRALLNHLHGVDKFGTWATVVFVPGTKYPYGVGKVGRDGIVIRFEEKPLVEKPTSAGIYINEPEVYEVIEKLIELDYPGLMEFEKVVIPHLASKKKLYSMFISPKSWIRLNTPKEYESAKKVLAQGE